MLVVAGIPLSAVGGTQTGVYVGADHADYADLQTKDVDDIPLYFMPGTFLNDLANRISYVFDLKGTSITLDTACSSSLVALHLACQSIRTGENTQAIVCGSHIMLSPDTMVGMSMIRYEPHCFQSDSIELMEEDCSEKKGFATRVTPGAQGTGVVKGLSA